MYFNSFEYILFLWTIYILYWTLKDKRSMRMSLLVIASYWFYAQSDWRFTGLLLTGSIGALIFVYFARFLTVAFNSLEGGMVRIHPGDRYQRPRHRHGRGGLPGCDSSWRSQ